MIRVAILYPKTPDSSFDVDYYRDHHLGKLVRELLAPALISMELDVGIAGRDGPAPFHVIAYLRFESLAAYQAAFAPVAAQLRADVPNYTNLTPLVLISECETL